MPNTTVVFCGLRPIYNLLFHFMHIRDFFNIILLTYYVKSMHLYVRFSVCKIGCLACKHAVRWENKYDSFHRQYSLIQPWMEYQSQMAFKNGIQPYWQYQHFTAVLVATWCWCSLKFYSIGHILHLLKIGSPQNQFAEVKFIKIIWTRKVNGSRKQYKF